MKMETTHVSETSTLYNHTPGNYPKEDNIQTKFLIPYEQLHIQSHHHHKQLIPEQYSGEYNPMYQLVYDQQVKPHPTKQLDIHPKPLPQ
jgi:hypothetical protein